MPVEIVEREGTTARYFVYDASGKELRQRRRDITEEIAEAKRRHVSLLTVLAEHEHVDSPKLSARPAPPADTEPLPPEVPSHVHDGIVLALEAVWAEFAKLASSIPTSYAAPEHAHENLMETLISLRERIDLQGKHQHEEFAGVKHGHEHGHSDLGARLSRLEAFAEGQETHRHGDFEARLNRIQAALQDAVASIGTQLTQLDAALKVQARHRHEDTEKFFHDRINDLVVVGEERDVVTTATLGRIATLEAFGVTLQDHDHEHGHEELAKLSDAIALLQVAVAKSELHTHEFGREQLQAEQLRLSERVAALGEQVQVEHQHAWVYSSEEETGGIHWTIERCWDCGRVQKHGRRL